MGGNGNLEVPATYLSLPPREANKFGNKDFWP